MVFEIKIKEHCRNKLFTKALIIFVPDKAKNLCIVALRKDFLTQSGAKRIRLTGLVISSLFLRRKGGGELEPIVSWAHNSGLPVR